MAAQNVGNEHQPEAAVDVFGGEEGRKNASGVFFGNASAIVDYFKQAGSGADSDQALGGSDALDRVLDGVDEHAVDEHAVEGHYSRIGVKISVDSYAGGTHLGEEGEALGDKLIDVDRLNLGVGELDNVGVTFDETSEIDAACAAAFDSGDSLGIVGMDFGEGL